MGRRFGKKKKNQDLEDAGSTQDETRVPDMREVLKKEKKELERLNDRIGNLSSTSWIQDSIVKTEVKRDRQEDIVRATQRACESLGLIKAVEQDLPGVEPRADEPRKKPADESHEAGSIPRTAIDREVRHLPSRSQPALPSCSHNNMADDAEGNRVCPDCGVIDAKIIEPTEQPPDEQPPTPEPPKRGARKSSKSKS